MTIKQTLNELGIEAAKRGLTITVSKNIADAAEAECQEAKTSTKAAAIAAAHLKAMAAAHAAGPVPHPYEMLKAHEISKSKPELEAKKNEIIGRMERIHSMRHHLTEAQLDRAITKIALAARKWCLDNNVPVDEFASGMPFAPEAS